MSAIITSQVTEEVTGHSKEIMHQHASDAPNDGRLFVMQHMYSAIVHDAESKDVWYVDPGASNHMTLSGIFLQSFLAHMYIRMHGFQK